MEKPQDFETIPCPLCTATTFDVIYPGSFPAEISQEFLTEIYRSSSDQTLFEQVVRCKECHLVYLNPRLNPDLIINSYAEGEDKAFIEQDSMRIRTFKTALKDLAKRHQLVLSGKTKVLDIGCAGGAFLRAARDLRLTVTGIEPSRWLGEYARTKHGLDVRSGTLSDYTFPEASFDLVTLWDVIEHIPNPKIELQHIHRLLAPQGLLVVNYPDFGSLVAKFLGKKWPFLLSVHLIYYTPETIRKQLEESGFKIIRLCMHWQTLELGYILRRIAQTFPFVRFIATLVEKVGLGRIPIVYWMGQTKVVAKKC
ncbi:MAG: class I SAM-dependent methyltransferase [Patescibacteria group bacterium]